MLFLQPFILQKKYFPFYNNKIIWLVCVFWKWVQRKYDGAPTKKIQKKRRRHIYKTNI